MSDLPRPLPPPGEWHRRGLCRWKKGVFFPEAGVAGEDAREICEACAVRVECGEYARENGIRFGIWGGENRELYRARSGKPPDRRPSRVVIPAEYCPRCRASKSVVYGGSSGGWLCLDCQVRWR